MINADFVNEWREDRDSKNWLHFTVWSEQMYLIAFEIGLLGVFFHFGVFRRDV